MGHYDLNALNAQNSLNEFFSGINDRNAHGETPQTKSAGLTIPVGQANPDKLLSSRAYFRFTWQNKNNNIK